EAGYASYEAKVCVLDANGALVGATIECSIAGLPDARVSPAQGKTAPFVYPGSPATPPGTYGIECTVKDNAGQPLANHKLKFEFARNDRFDVAPDPAITDGQGQAEVQLPLDQLPVMTDKDATALATAVLNHPMIAKSPVIPKPSVSKWLK